MYARESSMIGSSTVLSLLLGLTLLACSKAESVPDAGLIHKKTVAASGDAEGKVADDKTSGGAAADTQTTASMNTDTASTGSSSTAMDTTSMSGTMGSTDAMTSTGSMMAQEIRADDPIAPPPAGKRIRVMPLGASITQGSTGSKDTGYRSFLHQMLSDAKIDHEFVGSNTAQPGSLPKDQIHHEGHPGYTIQNDADNLDKWLGAQGADPDYILILLGSNDITQKKSDGMIQRLDAMLTRIIDKQKGLRPQAQIIIASLPLINDATMEAQNVQYAKDIVDLVVRRRKAGDKVAFVDVHAVIKKEDKFDNLHPNDAGYKKIAELWFQRISGK